MKAFLLAAGFGTRLRPLTDTVPKCLVPIAGKPLLQWWLELFALHGVSEVLINTHYLADKVRDYIGENNKSGKVKLHEAYEKELLGSGGTLRENKAFVENEKDFLICYADNLTNIDLTALTAAHRENDGVLTMALFHSPNPSACGIAALDSAGRITDFEEKPEKPQSDLANAGIYVADNGLIDYIGYGKTVDFAGDVLPPLCGKMYGYETDCYINDIGTPENYNRAQIEWKDKNRR